MQVSLNLISGCLAPIRQFVIANAPQVVAVAISAISIFAIVIYKLCQSPRKIEKQVEKKAEDKKVEETADKVLKGKKDEKDEKEVKPVTVKVKETADEVLKDKKDEKDEKEVKPVTVKVEETADKVLKGKNDEKDEKEVKPVTVGNQKPGKLTIQSELEKLLAKGPRPGATPKVAISEKKKEEKPILDPEEPKKAEKPKKEEGQLTHFTKDRPIQTGKRRPTRQPRVKKEVQA